MTPDILDEPSGLSERVIDLWLKTIIPTCSEHQLYARSILFDGDDVEPPYAGVYEQTPEFRMWEAKREDA